MSILKIKPDDDNVTSGDEERYSFHWEIPDWPGILEFEHLVTEQKLVFETSSNLTPALKTRWLVGLKAVRDDEVDDKTKTFARLYWQLLDIKGTSEEKLSVTVMTNLLDSHGFSEYNDDKKATVGVGDSIDARKIHPELEICNWLSMAYRNIVAMDDSVRYFLDLTIKLPPAASFYKPDQFLEHSIDNLCLNFENLLEDGSDSDIKIVSSDNVGFTAHKLILKAQCPVFVGMFNSDLSENKEGIIKTTDISGKTMKILLTYFYTGKLLPNWKEDDIIVEFTYAAGKYQMAPVLEMLDRHLGKPEKKTKGSYVDVQLLSLCGKLSLKNAEKRLLQLVIANIKKVNKCADLFEILGFEGDELLKKAEEKLGPYTVLKVWDCSLGSLDLECEEIFNSNALLVLAMVQGSSKKIERALLKRFAKSVSDIEETDELFKIIGPE